MHFELSLIRILKSPNYIDRAYLKIKKSIKSLVNHHVVLFDFRPDIPNLELPIR